MNKRTCGLHGRRQLGWFVILVVVITVSASGCESLRKKFTRKQNKKDKKEELVPVLDPVEYPEVVRTSRERYERHHSLWRVWYRDLAAALQEDPSTKRVGYIISQMTVQLEEMIAVLTGEKQKQLEDVLADLRDIQAEFKKPAPMRNMSVINLKLREMNDRVLDEFKVTAVESSLKS